MERGERFSRLLVGVQPRLYGFIFSLTHDRSAADDLLQEVSAILWRKFDDFEEGTDFGAWALQVARLAVFEWYRSQAKTPGALSEQTLNRLADRSAEIAADYDRMREALDACLRNLDPGARALLRERYANDVPVRTLADRLQRSRAAVYRTLGRLHDRLARCIRRRLFPLEEGA